MNAEGSGFVARKLVPSEPYEIVVRAPGFAPASRSWSPPAGGGESSLEIVLQPAHQLRGRVASASGAPLRGVELIVVASSGFELRRQVAVGARHQAPTLATVFSAADGSFRIDDLPLGPWISWLVEVALVPTSGPAFGSLLRSTSSSWG